MTETQSASPIGEQITDLEARIGQQRQKAADVTEQREEAEAKATEAEAMVQLGEARESMAWKAHSELEALERVESGAAEAVAILERRLSALRESEPLIVKLHNQAINVRNSIQHHQAQLAGKIDALSDTYDDGAAANRQLVGITQELDRLGYPSASALLEGIAPPYKSTPLPAGLWAQLAPPEVRDALAVWRSTPPGTLNQIVQSGAPGSMQKAQELTRRINEAESILSALTVGASIEIPAPQGMPEVVLGESRTVTPPRGIAHG